MYSSSKWSYTFTLLLFCLKIRCSGVSGVSSKPKEDQKENYSYVVNVCLQSEEKMKLSSGVLISKKRIITACHSYVNSTSKDSQAVLPPPDHFRVWAGHAQETGQWRDVEKFYCVNTPVAPPHIMGNDLGILIVRDEFELSESINPIGVNEIMKGFEIKAVMTIRTQCEVISWYFKLKERHLPDVENSLLNECPVETINITSCAAFLSAEVSGTSNRSLVDGNLMCVLPVLTNDEPCFGVIVPGTPVICSKKVLGIVSLVREPTLVYTFPVVLTEIGFEKFVDLKSSGRTVMGGCYSMLISLIFNAFLRQ